MVIQLSRINYRKQSILLVAVACCFVLARLIWGGNQIERSAFVSSPSGGGGGGCDAFRGEWVWDNNGSRPLYQEWDCPYSHKYTACQSSGRPDSFYQYWKWQPQGCNLPMFDPSMMLNILRGKRLMFVGDSVQRNQFESLVCMLQSVVEDDKKSFWNIPPSIKKFRIQELKVSIEFFWAPFLVESSADDIESHSGKQKIVHLDSIDRHGEIWNGADILVFNNYAWWVRNPPITYLYQGEVREYTDAEAYKQAIATWANWLETNINPRKQQVFFMSISPSHWGATQQPGSDGNCFNETYPDFNFQLDADIDLHMMQILGDILYTAKSKVTLLNITQLSQYRIDAHTSYYGVPDTWNEILYAYLLRNHPTFS